MESFDYLIVGGGLAASNAVEGIRQVDDDGDVLVISEEEEPPYHRPPLSKEYLQVDEAPRELLHVKPEGWFEEAGAEVRLGVRAATLDAGERVVTTDDGAELRGERLLLATGGVPRSLATPGSELVGVRTLRTVEDSEALRDLAGESERALLVGAGFIGMELAASLRELDVEPVVVEIEDRVWTRMLPPELSEFVREYFEARGVTFRLGTSVEEFTGRQRLTGARLDDGTELDCQMAVIGVGIDPAEELAADAGLAVNDGIVVDRFCETSHAHVYAAGDVARFPDPVFGDATRVEHWDHAKAQGRRAGRNMAGEREPYDHVSYFFSEAFDLSFNVFGRTGPVVRTVRRGALDADVAEHGCVVFGADEEGRVCAALTLNANDAMDECREAVRSRAPLEEMDTGEVAV